MWVDPRNVFEFQYERILDKNGFLILDDVNRVIGVNNLSIQELEALLKELYLWGMLQ